MATKLEGLKLDDAHATAVLTKAIEFDAFSEDMPETKKARIAAASEQIALLLDAYVTDGVNPDNDDEDVAEQGELIKQILDLAGVEVDEDGDVEFGDLPELDGDDDDDDNEGGEEDGDEAAVGIDDIIEGYDDLSAVAKVKAVKKLDLDPEDEDDLAVLVALHGYEAEQDKPCSRVMNWIEENVPEEALTGEAGEEDEPEEDEPEADGDGDDEPWEGYDKATAADVRKVLDAEFKEGNLTAEQIQYVHDYEEAREKPPTRKNVIKKCVELLAKLEEEPEEKPAKKASLASTGKSGAKKTVGNKHPTDELGTFTLTRDMVLAALADGEVEIELG